MIEIEKVKVVEGLVINAPEYFEDEEFREWLNHPDTVVMSWHKKGDLPGEWSDTIVLVDPHLQGEGADSDMPDHIWTQIVEACKTAGLHGQREHIPVRITNIR